MQQLAKRSSIWRVLSALVTGAFLASVAASGCASSDDNDADPVTPSDDAGACPSGQTDCKGVCVDTKKDRSNCGACGSVCAPGNVCTSGKCALSCPGGQEACNGSCVNLQGDRYNCGECGKTCAAGEVCWNGTCELSCQDGLTECDGTCVDTDKDRENCGGCGQECAAGEVCSNGECSLSCQDGLEICDGTCVNTDTDRANCGGCGEVCDPGEVCSEGECALSCQAHLTECSGSCVNTQTDRQHCGDCGQACDPGEVCAAGKCILSCQDGLSACGGTCVNTDTDRTNCGSCGKVCAQGEVCSVGECALFCQQGLENCDGACVNLDTDKAHCGDCDTACSSTQVCKDGGCACLPGQTACGDACVDLSTNSDHCGDCGNACGANQVCAAGECVGITDGNGEVAKEGKPKVALLASGTSSATDVIGKLTPFDAFAAIDHIAINNVVPTLTDLEQYDAVAVFTYTALADAAATGDVLADYLENVGGVVVFTMGTWELNLNDQVTSWALQGRYADEYALMPMQNPSKSDVTLGTILEPQSPLLAGVTKLDCIKPNAYTPCIHVTAEPLNGATIVAKWSDGSPLAVRKEFGTKQAVELNFFAGSRNSSGAWNPTGNDFPTLIKNALLYVVPKVMTAAKRLDLGTVPVFTAAPAQTLVYRNTSSAPQTITSIEVSGAHIGDFAVTPAVALPVTLNPGQTLDVGVVFTPAGSGLRAATVSATVDGFATKLTTLLVGKGV